ncbi:TPA: hypothetical protein ACH7DY_005594, partial [Escherichia coli]
ISRVLADVISAYILLVFLPLLTILIIADEQPEFCCSPPGGIVPSDGVLFHQKESDRGVYVFAFYYWLLASSDAVRFAGTSLSA